MKKKKSHSAVISSPGRWTGNNIFLKGGLGSPLHRKNGGNAKGNPHQGSHRKLENCPNTGNFGCSSPKFLDFKDQGYYICSKTFQSIL